MSKLCYKVIKRHRQVLPRLEKSKNNKKEHLMRKLIFSVGIALSLSSHAQTDIWLIEINTDKTVKIESAKNITNRAGYDNQPSFSKDHQGLYYTKMLNNNLGEQQADIFYYHFASNKHSNLTRTIQSSEYSPLETPLKEQQLSIIKVEPDGVQRLWTVDTKTGQQQMLNRDIKPVGYHAWGKQSDLTTFVLGEPMTLQYFDKYPTKNALKVDKNIGRSIRYNSTKDFFSYSKGNEQQQTIWAFNANTKKTTELIAMPARSQYYTWFDDSTLLTASKSKLFTWKLGTDKTWSLFQDVGAICPEGVSRIAVNSIQTKIALVCNESAINK